MSKNNDREHFDDYRQQTAVKHAILAAYLPAYFHILKARSGNLLLIDGFAGRGTYTNAETGAVVDGSPLQALKLIAETPAFHDKVSTIFIEADDVLFLQLKGVVDSFYALYPNIRKPECMHGTFSDRVSDVLRVVKGKLAPTFLFVDPCGVSGTRFDTIRSVMNCEKCEAFIFLNIDGVKRTLGLGKLSDVLIDLMGSQLRAQALYDAFHQTTDAIKREQLILSFYRSALKEDMGANYIIPFRIEHENMQRSSHYLIHVTKSPVGFRIMKDVMWMRGHDEDRAGGLMFVQSSRTNFIPLFDIHGDALKAEIQETLKHGKLRVSTFYVTWAERPDDTLCESAYRQLLLEMEAAGTIEVLTKDGKNVVGASSRPKRNGKPTLAKDYYVRLAQKKTEPADRETT